MNYDIIPEPELSEHSNLCRMCYAELNNIPIEQLICNNCLSQLPHTFTCFDCGEECYKIEFGSYVNDRQGIICAECETDWKVEEEQLDYPLDEPGPPEPPDYNDINELF